MFSLAALKALQIYGIAAAISMVVAVVIKILVVVTGRLNKPVAPTRPIALPPAAFRRDIPQDVIAAISAALAVVTGPHRILHIAPSKRSWSSAGRNEQHSHQPKHK